MQRFSVIPWGDRYIARVRTGRPAKNNRPPLGERIAAFRNQRGLSQQQLAEKLGISQQLIGYWERRSTVLRPEQLIALAEVLNVSVNDLLGQKNRKTRGKGPEGKALQAFEAVSRLPRRQQAHILRVVQALVAQASSEPQ